MMIKRNTVKTVLRVLLCATLMLSGLGGMTTARAVESVWIDSVYYEYEILPDGSCSLEYCRNIGTEVILPSEIDGHPVTKLGDYLLCNSEITSVTIPQSVTSIGYQIFVGCKKLTRVILPDGLREIGEGAFELCEGLTEIHIPGTVVSMGDSAFMYCGNLTRVTVGEGVKAISDYAFCECENLTSVTLPDGISRIGERAFFNCYSLKDVTFPGTLTEIGESAFSSCGFSSLTLPEGVIRIGKSAFGYCDNLTEVTIPWTVTGIGERAFKECMDLSTVTFEGPAPEIAEDAFHAVTATVSYPVNESSWTAARRQDYCGFLDWEGDAAFHGKIVLGGSVRSFEGTGLKVELWPEDGQAPADCSVVSNDRYRFGCVSRGSYILKVSMDHGVTREYPVTVRNKDITQDVQIHPIGDVSGDGIVDIGDVAKTYAYIREVGGSLDEYAWRCANVSCDSEVDILDVAQIYSHVRGTRLLW